MTTCDQCGAEVPQSEGFCPRCGAAMATTIATAPVPSPAAPTAPGQAGPPPAAPASLPTNRPTSPRQPATKLLPILAAGLVVAIGVIGWLLVAKPSGTSSAGSAGGTTALPPTYQTGRSPGTTAAPTIRSTPSTTSSVPTTTSTSTTTSSVDPETAAQSQIQQIVASDKARVAGILDQWVPQLSSKQVGLSDPEDPWFPGQPYTNQMILQAYKNYQQQYPSAMLVYSSDYPSFTFPGYWVVVLEIPFSSQDEALDWCDARGISRNNCIGTKIHT